MGKAARHEEHVVVFLSQFHSYVLPESGRATAYVNSHVQHTPAHTAHQLALRVRALLVMQTAHHASRRHAFVVLHETHRTHQSVKLALRERLEEISSAVGEYTRSHLHYTLYIGLDYFHCFRDVYARARIPVHAFFICCQPT